MVDDPFGGLRAVVNIFFPLYCWFNLLKKNKRSSKYGTGLILAHFCLALQNDSVTNLDIKQSQLSKSLYPYTLNSKLFVHVDGYPTNPDSLRSTAILLVCVYTSWPACAQVASGSTDTGFIDLG